MLTNYVYLLQWDNKKGVFYMKKLLIVLTVSLFLVSTAFISVSAKTIDPAQDHIKEIETLGYNLSELPTEEEVLENGDVKIWHCIYPEKFELAVKSAIESRKVLFSYR